jgi:hypothetical protein
MSAPAQAAAHNPLIVWQGAATLTSLSSACATINHKPGDSAFSVFRPRLDPAEPKSAISFTFTRSAHAFFRSGGGSDQMNGAGSYTSPWYSGRVTSTPGGNTGTYNFHLTPATVLATTPVVTIVGTINNFHGIVGCTVGFKGAFDRRP